MNTFTELNTYSSTFVTATDERTVPFAEFVGDLGTLAINISEGSTQIINQIFGSFQTLEATETGTANVVTVAIDLSNSLGQGAQVVWGTNKPAGVSVSDTGGVWTATNMLTTGDYFKTLGFDNNSAYIEFVDQDVNFSFTITASYPNEFGTTTSHTRTYNVVVGATSDEMTFPTTTTQQTTVAVETTLTDFPQVTDTTVNNATYSMTINPSTASRVSFAISSNAPYAAFGATGITIGPFTKSAINTKLANLGVVGVGAGTTDIVFTLTNTLSGEVSTGTMTGLSCAAVQGFTANETTTRTYTENTINTNIFSSNSPTINTALTSTYGDSTFKLRVNVNNAEADPYTDSGSGYGSNLRGWFRDGSLSNKQAYQILEKTDTITNLQSFLDNNLQYIPPGGTSATQTGFISIFRTAGFEIESASFSITGTADASAVPGAGTNTFDATTNTTNGVANFSITDEMRFFLKCDIAIIGAGGTGGAGATGLGGGGGGASEVIFAQDNDLVTGRNRQSLLINIADTDGSPATSFVKDYTGGVTGTTIVSPANGGTGGAAGGAAGGTGGFGGGGGANGGAGGSKVDGTLDLFSWSGGTVVDYGGPGATASATNGGDGGGWNSTVPIPGLSSTAQALPGPGGGTGGAVGTTYGSGGAGGAPGSNPGAVGVGGVAIIHFYEF